MGTWGAAPAVNAGVPDTCTLLVLAKPRARRAQLDLLLRSVDRHWPDARVRIVDEPAGQPFDQRVHHELRTAPAGLVAFATDDGLFYRPVKHRQLSVVLGEAPDVLCYSLRLGANTTTCYPSGMPQEWPGVEWRWLDAPGDYGYPGSVDAHVFRLADMVELLDEHYLDNPTALEVTLDHRCAELFARRRPLMVSRARSSYVGVPVNRVSEQSQVRAGTVFPQPADDLNRRFDAGERIDLERTVDGAIIDGAHAELQYAWGP